MGYKTYTRQDLANFTGRPVASFPESYINASAIPQALLLFKMGTCLASPDGLTDDQKQLVDFAVISLADAIHLVAPYQTAKASPFSSESIGSYSYSKAANAVSGGLDTGVFWFDKALQELSVCDELDGIPMSTGIEVFNSEGYVSGGGILGQHGNKQFWAPADVEASRRFGFDPLGNYPGAPNIVLPFNDNGDWVEDPNHPGVFIWED